MDLLEAIATILDLVGCVFKTHPTGDRQRFLAEKPRVFVDFHNADAQGRLRLNCVGTIEDLNVQKIELKSGQQLTLYSEDLEVDGVVEYSQSEYIWVVVIDWNKIRQIEEVNPIQRNLVRDLIDFRGRKDT